MDFHLLSIHGFLIVNRGLATLVKQSLLLSGIIDLRVVSDFAPLSLFEFLRSSINIGHAIMAGSRFCTLAPYGRAG